MNFEILEENSDSDSNELKRELPQRFEVNNKIDSKPIEPIQK